MTNEKQAPHADAPQPLLRAAASRPAPAPGLREALKWALDYIADGAAEEETPHHDCEYYSNPEKGHCEFHEQYGTARAALTAPVPTPHVSVVSPVDAQEVLADPHATPEAIEAAHRKAIVTPDPAHAPAPVPPQPTQNAVSILSRDIYVNNINARAAMITSFLKEQTDYIARLAIENHEAELCPEDYGCKEYIALLTKQRDEARAAAPAVEDAPRDSDAQEALRYLSMQMGNPCFETTETLEMALVKLAVERMAHEERRGDQK